MLAIALFGGYYWYGLDSNQSLTVTSNQNLTIEVNNTLVGVYSSTGNRKTTFIAQELDVNSQHIYKLNNVLVYNLDFQGQGIYKVANNQQNKNNNLDVDDLKVGDLKSNISNTNDKATFDLKTNYSKINYLKTNELINNHLNSNELSATKVALYTQQVIYSNIDKLVSLPSKVYLFNLEQNADLGYISFDKGVLDTTIGVLEGQNQINIIGKSFKSTADSFTFDYKNSKLTLSGNVHSIVNFSTDN